MVCTIKIYLSLSIPFCSPAPQIIKDCDWFTVTVTVFIASIFLKTSVEVGTEFYSRLLKHPKHLNVILSFSYLNEFIRLWTLSAMIKIIPIGVVVIFSSFYSETCTWRKCGFTWQTLKSNKLNDMLDSIVVGWEALTIKHCYWPSGKFMLGSGFISIVLIRSLI
jgi:hypothetical protein